MRTSIWSFLAYVAAIASGFMFADASAEEWGSLKGMFIYGGNAPSPAAVKITKDEEFCGTHKLVDESVSINAANKGVANVVVYLSVERGDDPPKVHESYAASASSEVRLDNESCRFDPHVVFVRTSQTLVVGNKDTVAHNTKLDCLRNAAVNVMVPAGTDTKQKLPQAERLPVRVSCSIHPWMTGWVIIKDEPYAAVTDESGKFEIANLPVGKHTFQVWHEYDGGGYVDKVEWQGKSQKWKKGKVEFEVKAGDNDLGTITIPAGAFGG